MKMLLKAVACLTLLAGAAFGQGIPAPGVVPFGQIGCSGSGGSHRVGTLFFAPCYATWQALILSGNAASGSQSIIIVPQGASGGTGVTLADGTALALPVVFNTNTPITINDANAETVTPTAVTIGSCPSGFLGVGNVAQCATVTATFSNTHGASALVYSGDAGIFEAITDAGNIGGGLVYWIADTGIVTLSTSGLTTTTTTKVPTNRSSTGCAARVTTTITVTASWAVGTTASGASFCSANSTLTAGTTGIANQIAPTSTGTTSALEAVVFTGATSNPGAGAIKARVWGFTPVQPSN